MSTQRLLPALALLAVMSSASSCTIAKPLVCAITTPAFVFGQASGGCGCHDPRGVACAIGFVAMFGAATGLVTGIVSDVNYVLGRASDPARNIENPFLTNADHGW